MVVKLIFLTAIIGGHVATHCQIYDQTKFNMVKGIDKPRIIPVKIGLFFQEIQGSKFSFRQTCPAGQVLPKIHSSLRKIYLPCFSGVKMKKKLKINHCFIDTEAKHVNEYG